MTVDALRNHRPEILGHLLETYGHEIQGVAYLILRDLPAAEDVVVDTLVTALERGDQLRDEAALRAWLLRSAANRALSVRRTSARLLRLPHLPERPAPQTDDEVRMVLLECVDRLAPRTRAAIVLRYYAGMSVREVADALGTSENTVKSQIREGLAHMRASLDEPATIPEAAHG